MAKAINASGQIVCNGQDLGIGRRVGVLLTPIHPIQGDLNGDGIVNVLDLLLLIGAWGPCAAPPAQCPADLDGDGDVNTPDLLILLGNWT